MTPHKLRSAVVCDWLRARVDRKVVQEWGGWKSAKVIHDHYDKRRPGDEDDGSARLQSWLDTQAT